MVLFPPKKKTSFGDADMNCAKLSPWDGTDVQPKFSYVNVDVNSPDPYIRLVLSRSITHRRKHN